MSRYYENSIQKVINSSLYTNNYFIIEIVNKDRKVTFPKYDSELVIIHYVDNWKMYNKDEYDDYDDTNKGKCKGCLIF